MELVNLTGQRFGRLTVQDEFYVCEKPIGTFWLCFCDCGNTAYITSGSLRSGHTRSCGCLHLETINRSNLTHGMTGTPIYGIWKNMRRRCNNPKDHKYLDYGGRGITVCDDWEDFATFYRDMGDRPSNKHSIERVDNGGPYSPDNCRWATMQEQCNNKRSSVIIEFNSESKSLMQWSRETGINYAALQARRRLRWPVEKMLTQPVGSAESLRRKRT